MKDTLEITSVSTEKIINDRFSIYYAQNGKYKNTFAEDVKAGLSSFPKFLLPKYFYDATGSSLFELICQTEEYYVTRTESSILKQCSQNLVDLNSDKKYIIELGSGSSLKTRYLLSSFLNKKQNITYTPIDVSSIMVQSSKLLLEEFNGLKIKGIVGEYEEGLKIASEVITEPKIILFLGSSIGNFNPVLAEDLLRCISSAMNENDSALIGFDMIKNTDVLNAAYDDETGITAKFNLNLLLRINEELSGNFDTDKFEHSAFFNERENRIEMHLVSLQKQEVYIKDIDLKVSFAKGETIHTEDSYKFTEKIITELASSAGLCISQTWNDSKGYFSLCMIQKT